LKRICLFIISFIFVVLSTSCAHSTDFISASVTVKNLESEYCFVYDYSNDSLTCTSDSNTKVYPASITKLLTAMLALEIMSPDSIISPGDEVYLTGEYASSAYIRPHHTLTLEMLIEGMMIPSGNDAAYAVSAACGRKISGDDSLRYEEAVKVFVEEMNEYAISVGCTGSNFTTPDGFAADEHYSTLHDIALISRLASENEIIMKYTGLPTDNVTYASGQTNTWINTNDMLHENSKYYCEGIIGLKTGSLTGNYCLVTLYDDGETKLLIGVFGAKDESDRYEDTLRLINGYTNNQ